MEPPVIFFNSLIIIIAILVIFLPLIVKSIARLLGKAKKKEEAQRQPAEAVVQLFKDKETLSEERVQTQLTESGEWRPEKKEGARSRINQLPPLQRAVVWSEILKQPVGLKRPELY